MIVKLQTILLLTIAEVYLIPCTETKTFAYEARIFIQSDWDANFGPTSKGQYVCTGPDYDFPHDKQSYPDVKCTRGVEPLLENYPPYNWSNFAPPEIHDDMCLVRNDEELIFSDSNTLELYTGSVYGDTLVSYYLQTENFDYVLNTMKEFKFDYMSLGMHDFNEGVDRLKNIFSTGELRDKVIISNMDVFKDQGDDVKIDSLEFLDLEHNKFKIKQWTLTGLCENTDTEDEPTPGSVDIKVTVGIIGILGVETLYITNANGIVTFQDEVETVRELAASLRSYNMVDFVIVMFNGFEETAIQLFEQENIDLVIATNSYRDAFPYGKNGDDPYLLKVFPGNDKAAARALVYIQDEYIRGTHFQAEIRVFFENKAMVSGFSKIAPRAVPPNYPLQNTTSNHYQHHYTSIIPLTEQKHGWTKIVLDNYKHKCCRKECPLGNYFADALLDYYLEKENSDTWVGAPIVLIDAGTIGESIGGPFSVLHVTEKFWEVSELDMYRAFTRLKNEVGLLQIPGRTLKELLENNIIYNKMSRNFLQMAGLRVIYDYNKNPMNRVRKMEVLCSDCEFPIYEPVRWKSMYKIIIPRSTAFSIMNITRLLKKDLQEYIKIDKDLKEVIVDRLKAYDGWLYGEEDRRIIIIPASANARSHITLLIVAMLFFVLYR